MVPKLEQVLVLGRLFFFILGRLFLGVLGFLFRYFALFPFVVGSEGRLLGLDPVLVGPYLLGFLLRVHWGIPWGVVLLVRAFHEHELGEVPDHAEAICLGGLGCRGALGRESVLLLLCHIDEEIVELFGEDWAGSEELVSLAAALPASPRGA